MTGYADIDLGVCVWVLTSEFLELSNGWQWNGTTIEEEDHIWMELEFRGMELEHTIVTGDKFLCEFIDDSLIVLQCFCIEYIVFYHDKLVAQTGGHAIGPPLRFTFEHFMLLLIIKFLKNYLKLNCIEGLGLLVGNKAVRSGFHTIKLTLLNMSHGVKRSYQDVRHLRIWVVSALQYDIECNPGPKE